MFASRYFNPRYWAKRYWPKVGGVPTDTADSFFSVIGLIDDTGQATTGRISSLAQSVKGEILPVFSVSGIIDDTGSNVAGRIDPLGQNVKGEI